MKRTLLLVCLAAGCLSSKSTSQDMARGVDWGGGTFRLDTCGYSVTTPDDANPPALGSPMLGSDPTPWGIHLGLASDPARSVVISWRTKDESTLASTVQFGVNGMTDRTLEGLTFAYQVNGADPVRVHEAHLCGLLPETVYSYRVGGKDAGGAEKWSDVYAFHTGPDKAKVDASVTIAVIGDTRGGYTTWGALLKSAQMVGSPDVILFSGDAVMLGPLQSEWDEWFRQAEPVLRQVPMISAHGNHDVNAVNYYAQLALPGDEENYSLDYGPAHITVANDTPRNSADLQSKIPSFLGMDFTASEMAPWKILLHHRPMYSAAAAHGGDAMLLANWGPIVDQHKIDLVLNGHDHDYERSKPMRAQKAGATPADGTIYVVAGSAGAPLYDNGTGAWTQLSLKTFNFSILRLRPGMLDMKAYDDQGAVIDTLAYSK
jgi:hypothetical protein